MTDDQFKQLTYCAVCVCTTSVDHWTLADTYFAGTALCAEHAQMYGQAINHLAQHEQ